MRSEIHTAINAAPEIDRVIEKTRCTPFTNRIASASLRNFGKLRFLEYSESTDPGTHLRLFSFAIARAHLVDKEIKPGYCRIFVEHLFGPALEWFASLEGNSIDNFNQLASVFLKQYDIFMETKISDADLWRLAQRSDEPLRPYITKFKEIKILDCKSKRFSSRSGSVKRFKVRH